MSFTLKSVLLLTICFVFNTMCCQNIETKSGLTNAVSGYGYLLGQDYVLDNIKKNYPRLKPYAIESDLAFKQVFGNFRTNFETLFIAKFSNEALVAYKNEVLGGFAKLNINTITSEDDAVAFIEEVKNRAKGNMPSPIREIICSYTFRDHPEEEFFKRFTQTFSTAGHSKSKGTDWSIKVPVSWVAKDADRPNIIQKFISEGGIGNENIMLMVQNLEEGDPQTEAEIKFYFTENNARTLIPSGGKFISFQKMTFDGIIGGEMHLEQVGKRLDFEFKVLITQYNFIYNKQFYTLYCSINENKEQPVADQKKFEKLFKLVATSIVVNQQYKR